MGRAANFTKKLKILEKNLKATIALSRVKSFISSKLLKQVFCNKLNNENKQ